MKRTRILFTFIAALASVDAFADTEYALLAPPESIERICMQTAGVTCVHDAEQAVPDNLRHNAALPLSPDQMSFLDRAGSPRTEVRGFLILADAQTPGGNRYYRASAKIFKTAFLGTGMKQDEDYQPVFWSEVGAEFSAAPVNSTAEAAFAADIDRKAEQEAMRRQQRQLLLAQKEADARYRASPEYAASERKRQIEQCKVTIVQARKAIAQDERVAKISGYENKLLREQAAISIVQCEDLLASSQ